MLPFATFPRLPLPLSAVPARRRLATLSAMSPPSTPRARRLKPRGDDLATAAALLRSGRLVAFPTETVYGLGADACNPAAVASIFSAKGRPSDNPLIVHVATADDIARFELAAPLEGVADRLARAFWPGPLTLVLPLHPDAHLAPAVSAGLPSVAIRVPGHPVASALLATAQVPVAAPSANLSGRPSPTTAEHVIRDLDERIDAVVDESGISMEQLGTCGLESTVVDLTGNPTILRPGAISLRQLEEAGGVCFATAPSLQKGEVDKPKAPGMKYRHYAPRAPLIIVEGDLQHAVQRYREQGKRVGILADASTCKAVKDEELQCVECGLHGDTNSYARGLYAALRSFDGEGPQAVGNSVDVILAVPPFNVNFGIFDAVMNRLRKAAAGRFETVAVKP